MELTLKDKVAVVTGAGGGIGVAYSRALAQAGARVVLADINELAAAAAAKELEADGLECLAVQADVADEASAAAMAKAAIERFGGIDILVNNAALMAEIPLGQPLSDIPIDFWERVMRVNLTGALICIQAVLPAMKERGRGKIINQSSGAAFIPAGVYGVTKLGLVSLTVSLARELAPLDINVNAIAPGFVGTDAAARSQPEGFENIVEQMVALKGIGDTDDVTGALIFLASSASDWITGQTLNVDGGWIMRI
ncbi:MAG: SDR family oxidoreductase [Deltaproteobacteria bacterium]|nr:SDR family oxidoreductase [Deltaproteobacteria bacterium]